MTITPVAVEVTRGRLVESRHRVAVAVAEVGGRLIHRLGDVDAPTYPRSSVKPIQALALVESGAAQACGLTTAELALACASHSGEPMHTQRVHAWLARMGLDERALACGAHPPLHKESARELRAGGGVPTALHNNCSGKHAGMLATAIHLGAPIAGYLEPHHAVQARIHATFEALAGESLGEPGCDGCGVPTWPMSTASLAKAMASLLDRGAAAGQVLAAMRAHPELVAGTGRLDTALMTARADIVAKGGAEGVHVAILTERGLAVALKAEDGAGRAADVALLAVLDRLAGGIADDKRLRAHARSILHNAAGRPVGEVRPVAGWPGF